MAYDNWDDDYKYRTGKDGEIEPTLLGKIIVITIFIVVIGLIIYTNTVG